MTAKRVTISDIAQKSGSSPTTVSLVLRDKGGIGPDTRERVLAAAQALGYERKAKKWESSAQVSTVALLFRAHSPAPQGGARGVNPFYSWVLTGMEALARTRQINLVYGTLTVNDDHMVAEPPRHLLSQNLDGIVLVGAFADADVATILGPVSCPVVVVDGPGPSAQYDMVASDNVGGARALTTHVIEAGHSRIALITRPVAQNPNFAAREQGYRSALSEHGLEPIVGTIEQWDVNDAIDQVLAIAPDLTAIVCVNDQFALDVCNALHQRGLAIPGDISVVGFDNTDHSLAVRPALTTMNVDKVGMGRLAITLLDYRMQWPDSAPATVLLAPTLLTRGSVSSRKPNSPSESSNLQPAETLK